ncbi:MAG: cyclase family protein [Anaerolineales bacterium]
MEHFDISVSLSPDLPVWPGDPDIEIERVASMEDGAPSNVSRLASTVHVGTHVDAPLHFIEGGEGVNDLALETLVGSALVVEFPAVSVIDEAVLVGAEIPSEIQRVLFKTRNSYLWEKGETEFNEDYVAIDESGARWLVEHGVKLVGVDYLSVAPFDDPGPPHRVLLGEGVVIVEGLNLHGIHPGEYQFTCLPLKIENCEGAPARAILSRD